MFKLGRDYIKENCSSFSFDRGLEYHFGNRVRSIQYNPQKRVFTAAVHDLKERSVSVTFDAEGRLAGTQCSCRLPGVSVRSFCEHIVAVLLLIEKRDGEGFFSQLKDREKARRIFELFSWPAAEGQSGGDAQKAPVQLEAIYLLPVYKNIATAPRRAGEPSAPSGGGSSRAALNAFFEGETLLDSFYKSEPERNARFFFRLKYGASSYMIKNIGNFVWSLTKNRAVDFSKKFTYDPAKHEFAPFDAEICGFLCELFEASATGAGSGPGAGANAGSGAGAWHNKYNPQVFSEKYLCLTDRQFRRFIDIFARNGAPLLVCGGTSVFPAAIVDAAAPLAFRLAKDENDILLKIEAGNELLPLTGGGDIVYRQNAVHRLPKPQAAIMRPFLNLIGNYRENDFRFISEDRVRFVSEVLPAIDRIGTLTIDEEVSSLIQRLPLAIDIYLDRDDKTVTADVHFRYGETEINPFAAASKIKDENPDGHIIVRDMARENEFLDILAEADFKVKNGRINLYDDENVYRFVIDILPKLQNFADVFYSQEFKRMSVRRGIGFRANMSFTGGIGASELLAFDFDTDLIDRDELVDIIASIREKKRYYKLKDGSILNLDEREAVDVMRLFDILDANEEDILSGRITMPRYRALYLDYFIRNSEIRNIGRDRILREFIGTLSAPAESEYAPPAGVEHVLRDYQRTGFKWLKALSEYSLGGILADDMGLGKTLQVLVLLLSAKENAGGAAPSLIIAPTSLIYNWCAEIEKFTPGLRYIAITGSRAERVKLISSIAGHDVAITSYPLIRRDYEDYKKMTFRYCVLDEAQYIKSPRSQNALSVKCLNARSRFALTGTPVENRLMDLWSIFDFVLPGYLRSAKAFNERYENAGAYESAARHKYVKGGVDEGDGADELGEGEGECGLNGSELSAGEGRLNGGGGEAASGEDGSGDAAGAADNEAGEASDERGRSGVLDELYGQIKPFILRRLKMDVLRELPEKIDMRMYAQMTDEQKLLYAAYLEKTRMQIESEISSNGFEKSQIIILAALTRLRQICCHPSLFIEDYKDESGKLLLLQELIREAIGGAHRILLFSQFTEMLAIIRKWADKENIDYFYLDGQTKPFERHRMINEFNGGARDMFLLSLKAGGTGVNLTGADTVIHYDPWWNPAVEDQATDRAYRIGQQKTVQVIKLLTAGSIEEKIYALQERKKQLIDAVVRPGETFLAKLSKADLDDILSDA